VKAAPWVSSWATWLAAWRWPRWIAFCAGLLWLAGYLVAFGTLDDSIEALARHPSASEWFTDSMSGRQEAKLVLFLFLVIAPIASLFGDPETCPTCIPANLVTDVVLTLRVEVRSAAGRLSWLNACQ